MFRRGGGETTYSEATNLTGITLQENSHSYEHVTYTRQFGPHLKVKGVSLLLYPHLKEVSLLLYIYLVYQISRM